MIDAISFHRRLSEAMSKLKHLEYIAKDLSGYKSLGTYEYTWEENIRKL